MTRLGASSVLVTGGGRGLGRQIAVCCARKSVARIVLWDIDEESLSTSATELRALGATVETAIVDVSDPDRIELAARELLADGSSVDILFNNAGVVVGKRFSEHSRAEIESSIRINVLGAMHVARAFLPRMIENGRGHIVNIASAVGLTPNPNMSIYAASKWAVLGWSESLRLELEESGAGPRVTTVCPSYIDTGMFDGARAPLLTPMLRPDATAERIVRAVESDKFLLRTPRIVNLLPVLRGVLPTRLFDLLIGRGFRIYNSMDHFAGKSGKP